MFIVTILKTRKKHKKKRRHSKDGEARSHKNSGAERRSDTSGAFLQKFKKTETSCRPLSPRKKNFV